MNQNANSNFNLKLRANLSLNTSSVHRCFAQQQGVVLVEFLAVLPFLLMIVLLTFDLTSYLQKQSKLERLSYSLATIISHREQYYAEDALSDELPLTQKQVTELTRIARNELSQQDIAVKVYEFNNQYAGGEPISFSHGSGDCAWRSAGVVAENLPQASNGTVEPGLFMVQLCQDIKGTSLFAKFSNSSDFSHLYARSVMVKREKRHDN
ncbi:tight adherence pilus pseudopilin TadF [Colwellia psychrerythraea]|uniref:TadE family protein n=1 Tax=Colwellia psychrerythraea TaxID=28229 RepID=A0A099KLT8_COLPS|nr:tight adherence pilus pseudopilin TadF [Colwellia psychrerythraea]KGJ91185.1 TadE family protein [Colwellia psychrerythraea]